MTDGHDIQLLPNQEDSSVALTRVRSSLVARGRKDAASLMVASAEPRLVARVRFTRGRFHVEAGKSIPATHKYGLIDGTGKFIVEASYYWIDPFSNGLAAFSVSPVSRQAYANLKEELFNSDSGIWGYLDHVGKIAIAPHFERGRCFSEDLAGVEINGEWGFIDKNGKFAIAPRFEGVRDFRDGIAIAKLGDRCGFIDRTGKTVIEHHFDCLREFSEGLAPAMIGGKYGYIDRSGALTIGPQFDCAGDFRFGVAIVNMNCVINRAGEVIFQCKEDGEVSEFVDGIARVSETGGYWDHAYFIDSSGQPLLEDHDGDDDSGFADMYDAAEDFSEGFGLVAGSYAFTNGGQLWPLRRYGDRKYSTRLYGYIDKHGKIKMTPQFHSARPFRDGLAVVDLNGNGKYGFVDTTGTLAIEPRFAQAHDFVNGLARVKEDKEGGKWGFIDKTGNVVIPFQFDQRDAYVHDFQQITT